MTNLELALDNERLREKLKAILASQAGILRELSAPTTPLANAYKRLRDEMPSNLFWMKATVRKLVAGDDFIYEPDPDRWHAVLMIESVLAEITKLERES